jgi:hypothetical protein
MPIEMLGNEPLIDIVFVNCCCARHVALKEPLLKPASDCASREFVAVPDNDWDELLIEQLRLTVDCPLMIAFC